MLSWRTAYTMVKLNLPELLKLNIELSCYQKYSLILDKYPRKCCEQIKPVALLENGLLCGCLMRILPKF